MSAILDNITGGGLLPHVYCRKVTLRNNSEDSSLTDVTLLLELYQDKNALAKSTWLNDLTPGHGGNLTDAIFVQVLPYKEAQNVKKMLPSYNPEGGPGQANVYTIKNYLMPAGDENYLPRGSIDYWTGGESYTGEVFQSYDQPPPPLSVISLGKIQEAREEIINGKPYYVLPFEYTKTFNPASANNSLGFTFYSFLHVPMWAKYISGLDLDIESGFFEKFVVEGPVNTAVVYMNGELQETREAFFLPNGRVWEGSVHHHGASNKAPDGYFGDGGLSSIDPGAPYRGWMVGEKHAPTAGQEKLRLAEVPNNQIVDLRGTAIISPVLLDAIAEEKKQPSPFDDVLEKVGGIFQKEKKKDFIGAPEDNDSEYSKLYMSKDIDGNARGLFFINMEELLKNNSSLFRSIPNMTGHTALALNKSKLLHLKVYRDRVKEKVIGLRRENFSNDQDYEEPSQLIGTVSDNKSSPFLRQISVNTPGSEEHKIRYFTFVDYDIAQKTAGLYQYRLEIKFKDGTHRFLYDLYRELADGMVLLQAYYDLAISSFTENSTAGTSYIEGTGINSARSEGHSKKKFKRYYENGAFTQHFFSKANSLFSVNKPWLTTPALLNKVYKVLGGNMAPQIVTTYKTIETPVGTFTFPITAFEPPAFEKMSLINTISPDKGSPEGIEFFSRMASTFFKKLEALLGINKFNKSSGQLTRVAAPNSYSFKNFLSVAVTPSDFIIGEEHSFEDPTELVEATSNKNVYSDYLSVGDAQKVPSGQTMRSLSVSQFDTRCRLEAAKLSPLAKTNQGFNGLGTADQSLFESNIALITSNEGFAYEKDGTDKFSNTGYSYLAPSIVRFSDPKGKSAYDADEYTYRVFNSNAEKYLDSDAPASTLFDVALATGTNPVRVGQLQKLYMSLLNHMFDKEHDKNADLSDPPYKATDGTLQAKFGSGATYHQFMTTRHLYNRAFEELGMTFHDPEGHAEFFEDADGDPRDAGAISADKPEVTLGKKFKYNVDDFSDKNTFPINFFKEFSKSKLQSFIKLEDNSPNTILNTVGYSKNMPNAFKIFLIATNFKGFGANEQVLQPSLEAAVQGSSSGDYDALFYFLLNTVVRVEVFTGSSGNAKNDENSWRLLKQEDLFSFRKTPYFCRLRYYDERLNRGIDLPIVDKYFLIKGSDPIEVPGQVSANEAIKQSIMMETEYDDTGGQLWQDKSEEAIDDEIDDEDTNNSTGTSAGGGMQDKKNVANAMSWPDDEDEDEQAAAQEKLKEIFGALIEEKKEDEDEQTAAQEKLKEIFGALIEEKKEETEGAGAQKEPPADKAESTGKEQSKTGYSESTGEKKKAKSFGSPY
jgi:hypothetical protein